MTSRCQFIASLACGLRSLKQRATKVAKSSRSTIAYSANVRSSLIELSLLAKEPSLELLNDLFVRRGERGGLRRSRLALVFDVAQKVEDNSDGAQIGCGRAVDDLSDDRFALGDFATPAIILGDDYRLVERFAQQRLQVLRFRGPPPRIAGLTLLKPGVAGRLAVAHLVVAALLTGHWRPPPRVRSHQSCGRSQRDGCWRRSAPASGGSWCRQKRGRVLCRSSAGRCARRRSATCCCAVSHRNRRKPVETLFSLPGRPVQSLIACDAYGRRE